jgi:hypothetical protein
VCASGTCTAGVCALRCNSGARRVLSIGVAGSTIMADLPAGTTVDTVTDAQWRAMTPAQFQAYQLIFMGEGASAANYQSTVDTRATWAPAVTGRIALTGIHMMGHTQGVTVRRATYAWLLNGPGTALYVDGLFGGTFRGYSQLVPIGTFAGVGGLSLDAVVVTNTAHPVMAGSSNSSLSNWSQTVHSQITSSPPGYDTLATASSQSVMTVRSTTCVP